MRAWLRPARLEFPSLAEIGVFEALIHDALHWLQRAAEMRMLASTMWAMKRGR